MMGYVLAALAICMYAFLQVLSKKFLVSGIPPHAFMMISTVILVFCAFLSTNYIDKDFTFKSIKYNDWILLGIFGIMNFLAFSIYLYALKEIPVVEWQLLNITTPILGALLAYFIMNESIHMRHIIGFAFVSVGLFIALKPFNYINN